MHHGYSRRLPRRAVIVLALILPACDPVSVIDAALATRERLSAGSPVPARPIPANGVSNAASEDAALQRAWFDRNVVGGYRRAGRRGPKCDPAAEPFLRDSAPAFLGVAMISPDLLSRARTLVAAGCDDPAVLYFAARAHAFTDDDSREGTELYERAYAAMNDTPYPRGFARFVASGLRADYERGSGSAGKTHALFPVELAWFLQSLKDGSYAADEDAVLAIHLNGGTGEAFFDRNRAAVVGALQSSPTVDPWVRELFAGMRAIKDAWQARSGDYGDKVKPEGWKGFGESLAEARKALKESYRLRPDRPEAATHMITVAMGGGDDETPRAWFDRAVAARLDHHPAYNKMINALRRRWGGAPDALLSFARECAETRRFDTEVPLQAFYAVQQIDFDRIQESRPEPADGAVRDDTPWTAPPSVYRDEDVYRLVSTVLQRYIREPGTPRWQRWTSLHAAVAYKAGQYADARKSLVEAGGTLDKEALDIVADEPQLAGRIEAFASVDSAVVRKAEDLYLARKADLALPLFRKARAAAPVGARPYLDERIAAATLEEDLRAGRTVPFLPPPSLEGWTPRLGRWSVQPDRSLLGTTGAKGMLIVADGRVGPDFEIEADVEVVSTSNGQFQVGIAFGREPGFWNYDWSSFRIKRTGHEGDVSYFSRHFYAPARTIKRPSALRSRVLVQSWRGRLWAYVDGEPVVTDYAPEWNPPRTADAQVGFGAYFDDNVVTARYRDVRLRRLSGPPVPPSPRPRHEG
jgi:hypothetical protein